LGGEGHKDGGKNPKTKRNRNVIFHQGGDQKNGALIGKKKIGDRKKGKCRFVSARGSRCGKSRVAGAGGETASLRKKSAKT